MLLRQLNTQQRQVTHLQATSSFNDDFELLQHAARLADNAEAALDSEFAEYQRLAKAYAPRKAPPYIKACDRDIDRVGRGIVLDWMTEQRIIQNRDEFESRITAPDSDQSETLEYNLQSIRTCFEVKTVQG